MHYSFSHLKASKTRIDNQRKVNQEFIRRILRGSSQPMGTLEAWSLGPWNIRKIKDSGHRIFPDILLRLSHHGRLSLVERDLNLVSGVLAELSRQFPEIKEAFACAKKICTDEEALWLAQAKKKVKEPKVTEPVPVVLLDSKARKATIKREADARELEFLLS